MGEIAWPIRRHFRLFLIIALRRQIGWPALILALHQDQYLGHVVMPDGSRGVPFTTFQRAPHWRSRATMASRPLDGGALAGAATVLFCCIGVGGVGVEGVAVVPADAAGAGPAGGVVVVSAFTAAGAGAVAPESDLIVAAGGGCVVLAAAAGAGGVAGPGAAVVPSVSDFIGAEAGAGAA